MCAADGAFVVVVHLSSVVASGFEPCHDVLDCVTVTIDVVGGGDLVSAVVDSPPFEVTVVAGDDAGLVGVERDAVVGGAVGE